MVIIGLCGKAGAGKDTVGAILDREFDFARYAFADALREVCVNALGVSYEVMLDHRLKDVPLEEIGCAPRKALQDIGMWFRERFGVGVWVRRLMRQFDERCEPEPDEEGESERIVITDARFPEEIAAIRSRGGMIWSIVRENNPHAVSDNHISETAIDDLPPDYTINNDGSLVDLRNKVCGLCSQLGIEPIAR